MTDITINGHRLTDEQSSWLVGALHHEHAFCSTPGELLELLTTPTPPPAPEVEAIRKRDAAVHPDWFTTIPEAFEIDTAAQGFRDRRTLLRDRDVLVAELAFANSQIAPALKEQDRDLARIRDLTTENAALRQRAEAAERKLAASKDEVASADQRGDKYVAAFEKLRTELAEARSTNPAAPSEPLRCESRSPCGNRQCDLAAGHAGMHDGTDLVTRQRWAHGFDKTAAPSELAEGDRLVQIIAGTRADIDDDRRGPCTGTVKLFNGDAEILCAAALSRREPEGLTEVVTWVPVAERVPFHHLNVIVRTQEGRLSRAWYGYAHANTADWHQIGAVDFSPDETITHWCALRGPSLSHLSAQPGQEGQKS